MPSQKSNPLLGWQSPSKNYILNGTVKTRGYKRRGGGSQPSAHSTDSSQPSHSSLKYQGLNGSSSTSLCANIPLFPAQQQNSDMTSWEHFIGVESPVSSVCAPRYRLMRPSIIHSVLSFLPKLTWKKLFLSPVKIRAQIWHDFIWESSDHFAEVCAHNYWNWVFYSIFHICRTREISAACSLNLTNFLPILKQVGGQLCCVAHDISTMLQRIRDLSHQIWDSFVRWTWNDKT